MENMQVIKINQDNPMQNDMCVRHMSEEDLQKEYEFLAAEKLIGKMRNFGLINEMES
jgi:hypothetical protein